MAKKTKFLDLIESHRGRKKVKKFDGTFLNYLDLISDDHKFVKC